MVTLNLKDGSTLKLDLSQPTDREKFNSLGQRLNSKPSDAVTGIWINTENQNVTLPIPSKFRRVFFYCETLMDKATQEERGEVVHLQADDVRLTITQYRKQKMVRVDLRHTGKQRFDPGGLKHE